MSAAAMKCLTVTSSQLEDIRIALVERRNTFHNLVTTASHTCTAEYWAGMESEVEQLLILVAKA